jgi:hypothetical protein
MLNEDIVIPIAGMLMIIVLAIGIPLVRALGKRWERESGAARIPADVGTRLERIEQAVEAIAVEVERISEGQRFTTKLLSDRPAEPVPVRAPGDRPSA